MRARPSPFITSTRHQAGAQVISSGPEVSTGVSRPVSVLRSRVVPAWSPPPSVSQGHAVSAQEPGSSRTATAPPVRATERISVVGSPPGPAAAQCTRPPASTRSHCEPKNTALPVSVVSRRAGPPEVFAVHSSVAPPSADSTHARSSPAVAKALKSGFVDSGRRRSSRTAPSAPRSTSRSAVPSGLGAVPTLVRASRNRPGW
ncbi:hypothetical protein GCM10020358_82630 [Amorphoplanes nipponensis]|uniref:hypothetical protein n=1 Tax=Actinoplanes nipponensis TaxID=135950 RepID=UPI0031EAEF53